MSDDEYLLNPGFGARLEIDVRRRGQSKFVNGISLWTDPEMVRLISDAFAVIRTGGKISDLPPLSVEVLKKIGAIVKKSEVPPPVVNDFGLESANLEFVPEKFRRRANDALATGDLKIAGSVFIQSDNARPKKPGLPPTHIFGKEDFPGSLPLAWVESPSKLWTPYRLTPEWREKLESLMAGAVKINGLDKQSKEMLYHAGILREASGAGYPVNELRTSVARDGYGVLPEILPPLRIASLRRHYRSKKEAGLLIWPKTNETERWIDHNDPLGRFLHRQTGRLMREITGEAIIPSYCLLSAYVEGAALPKHVDREQCLWNASLLIDSEPDVKKEKSWPIFLEIDGNKKQVNLEMGDAVIYRGTEITHWREKAPAGLAQTLLLLHYVPIDFTASLE